MRTLDSLFAAAVLAFILISGVLIYEANNGIIALEMQHEEDYGLGSVVTTTAEYKYLTNDSFTGVVVRGDALCDPSLTVRSDEGIERMFAIEFLEPMR